MLTVKQITKILFFYCTVLHI